MPPDLGVASTLRWEPSAEMVNKGVSTTCDVDAARVVSGTSDGTLKLPCTSELISEQLTCTAHSIATGKYSNNDDNK